MENKINLIYGTAWKKEKTADLVIRAVKCGFRAIDTACQTKHYNETGVGEAIRKLAHEGISREDLYIQTKFSPFQDQINAPYDKKAPLNEQIAESFEVSKKNLGVNYVDGFILHSPMENMERTMIAWDAMEQIYHFGRTRKIGISNCYDLKILIELYERALIKPKILQNRFYQDSNYDREIRKFCKEKQIIYQSFWTLTANPQILNSEIIQKASQIYNKTTAQIFFRVLIDVGIVPLVGTCSEKHMKEDLDVFNINLPKTLIQEICSLFEPKDAKKRF